MVSNRVLTVAAVAGLCAFGATSVQAQTPPAPTLNLSGQVSGICMLSQTQLMGQSKAGEAASQRLQQLAQQARREVNTMRESFSKKVQAFRQQQQSMQPQQREDKQKQLQAEAQGIQQKGSELEQRLNLTRARALNRIVVTAKPLIEAAYKAHGCGILLDRDSGVLGGNDSNDLTDKVVQALDKKMPTISFSLAALPKQSQGK
jgi:Skp family chaperone for outer membrane proteins